MSTTLLNAEIELSKQLSDYWSSTTTSAGSSTTIKDTALMAKANQWIDGDAEMYGQITSGDYDTQERKIVSLDNSTGSTGTLTTLAHGGTIASGVTYRVHRLFKGADKRQALISATKLAYPSIFKYVRDESLVSGNWLKDGSFERWTTSTNLTDWTESADIATQTSTAGLFKTGAYSAKLSTAVGNLSQVVGNWDDLKRLAGKHVKFSVQGHCNTANCLRIGILYDGTNITYSDYHAGDSAWTEDNDPLEVEVDIDDNPTSIAFRIYHDVAAGTSYVDDARVITYDNPRIYIGHLGLAKNRPHGVFVENSDYSITEPWVRLHGIDYDTVNGYMYLPDTVLPDFRLRMEGIGYLGFLVSGVESTALTATIDIDAPQLEILVAQAALYLCKQKIMPSYTSGEATQWQQAYQFWQMELAQRISKFGMTAPLVSISWGV